MSRNIDKIIEEIHKLQEEGLDENKYSVDVKKVLERLRAYEVETIQDYKENNWSNAVNYYDNVLTPISDAWAAGITFNFCGRITNDVQYFYHTIDDAFYVAICVHKGGEVRNFANYTGFCLLKFEPMKDFGRMIHDIEREVSGFTIKVNGREYGVIPHMFSEYLEVYCTETGEVFEIIANNDDELKEEISKIGRNTEKKYSKQMKASLE